MTHHLQLITFLAKQSAVPSYDCLSVLLCFLHMAFPLPFSIQDKKNWIQLILSILDNLLLYQIIWESWNWCFFWRGSLVKTQFWSRQGSFTQPSCPATPSHPQNELVYCSGLKLTSPSVQGSTKPFMLSRSQLAAWSWGLEQTGSASNKVNINKKHLLNTQKCYGSCCFQRKLKTPEPSNPGCGRGQHNQMDIGKIQINLDISMHSSPWVGTSNLTQYSPCIPKGSVFLMLTLHWINQPGPKVPLKLAPKNTANITADLQLLTGQKAERWKAQKLSEKMHILRWSLLISLEGLPRFWKPFQIKDSSGQGQKGITES